MDGNFYHIMYEAYIDVAKKSEGYDNLWRGVLSPKTSPSASSGFDTDTDISIYHRYNAAQFLCVP